MACIRVRLVLSEDVRRQLADTRAARLIAENKACVRKAQAEAEVHDFTVDFKKRQLQRRAELFDAQDVSKLKKMQETQVMRRTETNKVAVEKAFGSLASSGNVPSLVGGHAVTIKSGSISPNSSASEAEVRALQKDNLDTKKKNDELVRRLQQLQMRVSEGDLVGAKAVCDTDCGAMYAQSAGVTIGEDGEPACGTDDAYAGYVDSNGRFHFGDIPEVFDY